MVAGDGTSGNTLLQVRKQTFRSVLDEEGEWNEEPVWDDNDMNADEEEDMLKNDEEEDNDFDENDGLLLGEMMENETQYEEIAFDKEDSRMNAIGVGLELHVRPSPEGDDTTGDGTLAKPYATVKGAITKHQSAIEGATQPTYMYVSGTFFPPDILSTSPWHGGNTKIAVNAPQGAPLIVTPPQGSVAKFEGRAKLSDIYRGGWKKFKKGNFGGHIYWTTLLRPVWQLWLGDKSLTVARYPDVERDWFEPWPKTFPLTKTSARGAAPASYSFSRGQKPPENTSYDDYAAGTQSAGYWGGWFTTDGGDPLKAIAGNKRKNAEWDKASKTGSLLDSKLDGFNFTGGILHSRLCWKTEFWHPLQIKSHTGMRINFKANFDKVWKGPDTCTKGYKYPEKFYIEALDALNRPGEWWYDKDTQRLYVYLAKGARPDQVDTMLMGKVNDRALDFTVSKNVVLRGLVFFGTFASAGSSGGGRIESSSFTFPNYPRHILWENVLVQNQMVIENQHFVDNDIRYYCYGTLFTGLLVHVENNLIEYGIYGCGPMGCGAIFVKNGTRPFVARNTIRYTQQWHGIVWLTSGFEGAFNHVHDISTVRDDASNFQTKYSGERKSHMHHNWAYNSELKGVRFDTCGGKGTDGHPECGGAIWNNAFANGQRVDFTVPGKGVNGTEDGFVYNKFSRAHNNAADILSKSDQRCALPLPGKSTHNYAAKCPQDNAQARTPMKDLLRDPYNFDFRPKTEQYPKGLLQGAKTNVPKFKTINGSNIDVSGGFDIGAYQDSSTTYWIPGKMFVQPSTPVPPHTTTTARADLDLMFLEGRGAAHHNVYFSQDPCQAWRAWANGPQHIAQLSGSNIVHRNLLGDLQAATWYYWRVDAVAADGTVRRGPLWCFAVGAGEGGCSGPPCSQWEATIGQACVTDDGSESPSTPTGCG